jgi:hypothetical protein
LKRPFLNRIVLKHFIKAICSFGSVLHFRQLRIKTFSKVGACFLPKKFLTQSKTLLHI